MMSPQLLPTPQPSRCERRRCKQEEVGGRRGECGGGGRVAGRHRKGAAVKRRVSVTANRASPSAVLRWYRFSVLFTMKSRLETVAENPVQKR